MSLKIAIPSLHEIPEQQKALAASGLAQNRLEKF
jgi:hypothetical protein